MDHTEESTFASLLKRAKEEREMAGQHLVSEQTSDQGRVTWRNWSSAKPDAPKEEASPSEFAERCRQLSKLLLGTIKVVEKRDYLTPCGQLRLLERVVDLAVTDEQREQVVAFMKRLTMMVVGSYEEHLKQRLVASLADADPGIFFPFCRTTVMTPEEGVHFYLALRDELDRRIPVRPDIVERLSTFAARRMIGDQTTRTPLLYGPPGAGKSELANQFADAASVAGLPAAAVFQSLAQDGRKHDQADLALLGSSLHYSNGTPGLVYDTVKNPALRLGVVVLDEADKTDNPDHLVGLLDPRNPLQDHFVREVVKEQDMRHKCLFILTANDPALLGAGTDDPLWSRLDPLYLRPYEIEELVELGVTVLTRSINTPYCPSTRHARSVVRETLNELGAGTSFRAVLDRANEKLFFELLRSSNGVKAGRKRISQRLERTIPATQRRTIGFKL